MGFNKKAKQTTSSYESNIDWEAYNQHLLEQINEATEDGDDSVQVCIISGLVDTGTQPPQEEYTVYDWEDSEQQNKLLKANFGCFVEDDKFHIPNRKNDTMVIMVDFPTIQINYGAFFSEDGADDWKPYRHLYAGDWKGVATPIILNPKDGEYNPKSRISKLAKVTGCIKGSAAPADFDLGELMGKDLVMDITAEQNGEYININVKDPAKRNKAIPIPDHDIEPFGVMIGEENDPEAS